jgi:hypothetical protein
MQVALVSLLWLMMTSYVANASDSIEHFSSDELDQLSQIAFQYCTNEKGEFDNESLSNSYIRNEQGEEELCADFLQQISVLSKRAVVDPSRGHCGNLSSAGLIDNLQQSADKINQRVGCESGGVASCLGDFGCDLYYSFFSVTAMDPLAGLISQEARAKPPSKALAQGLVQSLKSTIPGLEDSKFISSMSSCAQSESRNCVSTFVKGLTDSLVGTWRGAKIIGNWLSKAPGRFVDWSKEKVQAAHRYFNRLDSFTTMKMHLISSMSDLDLAMWATNQLQALTNFVGKVAGTVYDIFMNALKNDYGCHQKIDGKCVSPMDLDCLNCRDLSRAFCGFIGVATPEILMIIATGGGGGAGGGLISAIRVNASILTKKASSSMREIVEPIKKGVIASKSHLLGLRLEKIDWAMKKFTPVPGNFKQVSNLKKADSSLMGRVCRTGGVP